MKSRGDTRKHPRGATGGGKARRRPPFFAAEPLERRVLLAAAIAAFGQQQSYPTGANPLSLTIADVNRDGKQDVIVANNTDNTISVLAGIGDGTFQPQQTFAVGQGPISVTAADLNVDGKPDLIAANYIDNTVSVLFGNGDGTFQVQQTFATGVNPIAVATADVNGDGKPDILVANYTSGTVTVLLGNGDGTFQPERTYSAGPHPISIAAADLNGDGKLDLAVTNYTASAVSILLGNGSGAFPAPQTFATGSLPRSIAVADMNRDGKLDLLTANKGDNDISELLGIGGGTFLPQQTFAAGTSPRSIAISDVNVDGKPDIIVANSGDNTAGVLLGNRDGTYQTQKTFSVGTNPYSIAVANLNGDGRPDLLSANQGSNDVDILLGDVPPNVLSIDRTSPAGPSTYSSSVTYTITFNEPVSGLDPTDFSLDLNGITVSAPLVVTPVSDSVYTVSINGILGQGTLGLDFVNDGSVRNAAGNPIQPGGAPEFQGGSSLGGGIPRDLAITDVNGDGNPDLVMDYPGIVLRLGNGDGTFNPQRYIYAAVPVSLAVGDVNGDGKPDMVVADYYSGRGAVSVLLGNGDGTFQAQHTFQCNAFPVSVVMSDVNGDGKLDLLVTTFNTISVLLGNGDGSFQRQQTFTDASDGNSLVTADVNGDGKPDLITEDSGLSPSNIHVLLGNGNGTFQAPLAVPVGMPNPVVSTADINLDGKVDILVASPVDGRAAILLGNGDGTFQAPMPLSLDAGAIATCDINLDGKPDLALSTSSGLVVLLGNGNGTFRPPDNISTSPSDKLAAEADVNDDGWPDLIVDSASGSLDVFLGMSNGDFVGQTYTITLPNVDVVNGTSGIDQVTLRQDSDRLHIDWTTGFSDGQLPINDPSGLTINGNGSADVINLDYTQGNPLPSRVSLNGTFVINGLSGSDPLGGTSLDLNRSTVYVRYSTSDPLALIQQYLNNGYNNGAWNGGPTPVQQVVGATGFDQDVIAEAGAANALAGTSIAFDGVNVWYEQGFPGSADTGLPPDGTTFTSAANPTVQFQLQSYASNNVAFIPGGNGTTTLTLTTPGPFTSMNFLAAASDGNATMTVRLNFSDGSTTSTPLSVLDWFHHPNPAIITNGRVARTTTAMASPQTGFTMMYEYDFAIPAIDWQKTVTSVTFQETSGNQLGIFAISGAVTNAVGVITSSAAADNTVQCTGIGYADSADGLVPGQPPNTIELKYTLYGDTTLSGTVGFNDFTRLTQHYNQTTGGTWDTGDFNYDGSVNFADFTLMTRTYNTSFGSQALAAVSAVAAAASTPAGPPVSSATKRDLSSVITVPAVQVKPAGAAVGHHVATPKHTKKHRR